MAVQHFDLVVLGTGPSGGTVAKKSAKAGHRVAIVEAREFGGTCALRGCNPKKVFTNAGSLVNGVRSASGKLIADANVEIDWSLLQSFKRTFTEPVVDESEASFREAGIATFHGAAKFTGSTHLEVGQEKLTADRILIATGAIPAPLEFSGSEHAILSDEFLDLSELPGELLFIGGGYVSMEFAHVVARAGRRVIVVERGKSVLSGFDPDLVAMLVEYSKSQGLEFHTDCEVNQIDKLSDGAFRVSLDNGDVMDVGLVVHGAGRVPNISSLNLGRADIDHDRDGIKVDKYMRSTSNPNVFATGDCAASDMPRLTPVANEEARIVSKNLQSGNLQAIPDYGPVAKVAFTTPSIASVGLSEEQAEKSSADVNVRFDDTSTWGSVRKLGTMVAGYKVIIDKESDLIVGAHLLGPASQETINLFALAMKHGLTATDMKSTLFAFPTFASDVRRML
ncbi:NAD(P)/FAD-dependent oxidoreductase [Rubripirellula amarantea]|nr:NAD(P)/FAD-dependent oxidoreductase [Rubripirellula amarantea]